MGVKFCNHRLKQIVYRVSSLAWPDLAVQSVWSELCFLSVVLLLLLLLVLLFLSCWWYSSWGWKKEAKYAMLICSAQL